MSRAPAITTRLLPFAYVLGGAVSLVYQVVWYQALVDHLGASATTFLVVLCAFIGGLGLGSIASRRAYAWVESRWGGRGLVNYGRTELAVAVSVAILFSLTRVPLVRLVGRLPYRPAHVDSLTLLVPMMPYVAIKLLVAVLAVGVPCVLMGMTYPYLCSLFPDDTRLPSKLYAANTLGACLAVVSAQFIGIRVLGYLGCLAVALTLNIVLGLVFALCSPAMPGVRHQAPLADTPTRISSFPAALGGFLCGGLQALSFVIVKFTLGPTRGSFALLSFFAISGIWLASTYVHSRRPRRPTLVVAAWLALAWCLAVWPNALDLTGRLVALASRIEVLGSVELTSFLTAATATGMLILVPYGLWSLLLPALCDAKQAAGENLSRVYGLSTLSFLGGVLAFGWLLQLVNVVFAARAFVTVAAVALVLLSVAPPSRLPAGSAVVAAMTAVALCLVLPRGLGGRLLPLPTPLAQEIEAFRSSPQQLVWVRADRRGRSLMFDGYSMSGTSLQGQIYMRGMAHLPLLLHPGPRRVLLICYGVGSTADAIRTHSSVRAIDVVDLSADVFRLSRFFRESNRDVLADPRLRLVCDDGRQFLELTPERYDFVTMEPPPPLQAGISRLYSAEYYEAVKRRLAPGGIVSQWLPEGQMDERAADLIVATFADAFPRAFIFVGAGRELILVGSERPFDFAGVAARLADEPAVREDLDRFGLGRPSRLLARIMMGSDGLHRGWSGRTTIRDGFASLDTILLSPVQQTHRLSRFAAVKPELVYHPPEVLHMLRGLRAADLAEVRRFFADPTADPALNRIVPPSYLTRDGTGKENVTPGR